MKQIQLLRIPYEQRTYQQHTAITTLLTDLIPSLSFSLAKLLSFFTIYYHDISDISKQDLSPQTLVLYPEKENQQHLNLLKMNSSEDHQQLPSQKCAVIIRGHNISKCQKLIGGSIEEEIKFLIHSSYFTQIPKKRIYHILRQMKLIKFSFGQKVYHEGQRQSKELEGKGIFIVRKGELCFSKKETISQKNIELLTFSEGYIFGIEEEIHHHHHHQCKPREFTVTCKSSEAYCYQCSYEFFNNFLKTSCEKLLKKNRDSLNVYINQKMKKTTQNPMMKSKYFINSGSDHIHPKAINIPQLVLNRYAQAKEKLTIMTQRSNSQLPSIYDKEVEKEKKIILNKMQSSKLFNPEYQQQLKIMDRKEKFNKMRQLTKPTSTTLTRGEVLFSLMKHSWHFERERKNIKIN